MGKRILFIFVAGLMMINSHVFAGEKVTWERVPNAGIPGYNIQILEKISLDKAKRKCIEGGFKSVDYERKARRAFLQNVNMDEKKLKTNYPNDPYDHYTLRRPPKPIGIIKALTGNVWYGRTKEELEINPQRLKEGDTFQKGSFIKTGKHGRAFIVLGNGIAKASIGINTIFNIDKYTEHVANAYQSRADRSITVFNLIKGSVRALSGALFGKGDRLNIATRNSICGCRGTDFLVKHDEATNTDIILVKDGAVEVTGVTSGQVLVHAGEQVYVQNGTPERVRQMDKTLWLQHVPAEN